MSENRNCGCGLFDMDFAEFFVMCLHIAVILLILDLLGALPS